jgi:hypothetical protein
MRISFCSGASLRGGSTLLAVERDLNIINSGHTRRLSSVTLMTDGDEVM